MPSLLVHQRAQADVEDHAVLIARDNMQAAIRYMDAAERAFLKLSENPGMGPEWEPRLRDYPGLRFWPITGYRNYLVLYFPREQGVEIVRVIHGARDVTRVMGPGL
jgi:toxin ParE1/3/4